MSIQDLEKTIEKYGRDIFSFCVYLTGDWIMAEELYQDIFVTALEHLEDMRAEEGIKSYFLSTKSGEPSISLEISGEDETLKYDTIPKEMKEENERRRNSGYTHSREIDGLEVEYFSDTFLFVPNDYEPTEEEESLDETDPNFYISYGGDQDPYYSHGQTIVFVLDGITYEMQVFDSWMSEDEFYEMSEQLITYIMSEK